MNNHETVRPYFLLLTAIALSLGCSRSSPVVDGNSEPGSHPVTGIAQTEIRPLDTDHLPNPVQVHPRVISGGLPEGDVAFAELKALGVRTVISVDGATPDVETARRHGLRYVHLPHGYDGIPQQRTRELAKAVRELDGPVYIHCHHGKHRSPAAASVACVTAGLIAPAQAIAVLELAGTSRNYRGLYQSAAEATPLDAELLKALPVVFRERVAVPPLAEAMVAVEHVHDHLQAIAAAGWQTPADHPDLVPAHEALLLREQFTELLRTDEVRRQPEAFRQILKHSEAAALELEHALRSRDVSGAAVSTNRLDRLAAAITADCKDCHQAFRDIPLQEKTSGK